MKCNNEKVRCFKLGRQNQEHLKQINKFTTYGTKINISTTNI